MPATELAPVPQRPINTWCTVDAVGFVEDAADQRRQSPILAGPVAFLATEPRVEPTPGDLKGLAHQAYSEDPPVVADELKPQLLSFAK
jgi:hypothetical protein